MPVCVRCQYGHYQINCELNLTITVSDLWSHLTSAVETFKVFKTTCPIHEVADKKAIFSLYIAGCCSYLSKLNKTIAFQFYKKHAFMQTCCSKLSKLVEDCGCTLFVLCREIIRTNCRHYPLRIGNRPLFLPINYLCH